MKTLYSFILAILISQGLNGQNLYVNPAYTAEEMIMDFFNNSTVSVSNVTFEGFIPGVSYFEYEFQTSDIQAGLLMTTGTVYDAFGPNKLPNTGIQTGGPFDEDINMLSGGQSIDATIIEFDLVTEVPELLEFEYVFASEEYTELIYQSYSDKVGIFISGPNIYGPFENDAELISVAPDGAPVSVYSVNDYSNSEVYIPNIGNIENLEYDGLTTKLNAVFFTEPNVSYHIKLVVSDMIDGICDSGLFLSYNSLGNAGAMLSPLTQFEIESPLNTTGDTVYASSNVVGFKNHSKYMSNILWDFGNGETSTKQKPDDVNFEVPGIYTVTLYSTNYCCTDSMSITLVVPEGLQATANVVSHVSCFGEANGQIDLLIKGGSNEYNVEWIPEITDLNAVSAGVYNYFISDGFNTQEGTLIVTQPDELKSVLSSYPQTNTVGGKITLEPSGGTEPYEILWSTGDTTLELDELTAGTYTVTITDANNCKIEESIEIQDATLSANINIISQVSCFGHKDGKIELIINSPSSSASISWEPEIQDLDAVQAGNYNYIITDDLGNILEGEIQLTQPEELLANLEKKPIIGTEKGSAKVIPTGGTEPYDILWSTGEKTLEIIGLEEGTYSVIITDTNNCSTEESFVISEKLNLNYALIIENNPVDCFGDKTALIDLQISGGSAPYDVVWEPSISSEGNGAGLYQFTITDVDSEILTGEVLIEQPEEILINSEITDAEEGEMNGVATVMVQGGVEPYAYLWSNGEKTAEINNLSAGVYQLTVTDANNCVSFHEVEVKSIVGLDDNEISTIKVYPNLVSDQLTIHAPNHRIQSWFIHNAWGHKMTVSQYEYSDFVNLDCIKLTPGIYYVSIFLENQEEVLIRKFIKL